MISLTNQNENSVSLTNQAKASNLTWADETHSWASDTDIWAFQGGIALTKETKNSTALSNESKN